MYICEKCGKPYEDYEVETKEKLPYGEKHCGLGEPMYDLTRTIVDDECECGGEIVKAKPCKNCNKWTTEDMDFCRECLEEHKTLDTMLEIGADYEEKICINGFLACAFTKEDIELILIDTLKNGEKENLDKAIEKYFEEDMDYFLGVADKKCRTDR